MNKFTLQNLLAVYRQPHEPGLDLPGAAPARDDITDDPAVLRGEQQQADNINGDLPDIGNADLLEDDNPGASPAEPDKPKTHLEEHEDMLDALAAKRRKHQNDANGGNIDDDAPDGLQLPGAAPAPVAQAAQAVNGFYTAPDGTVRYRAEVDGQVIDVTADAAREAMLQEVGHQRSGQAAPQPVPPAAQQPAPTRQSNADALNAELTRLREGRRAALKDMYDGDETAIDRIDALDQQILDLSMKSVDVVGQMTEHTQKQNAARWQSQIGDDEQTLLNDPRYAAVTSNPAAWELVVREAGRIMHETKAHLSGARPLSVMQQAADNMLNAIGAKPATATAPAAAPDVRQQRKQQLGNTAVTAGGAPQIRTRTQAPAPVPDGGATPQQGRAAALAELRKAKGERD